MSLAGTRGLDDLKKQNLPGLEELAAEIRHRILSVCMKNGGHLGASLGAVELAIALHYCFESPQEPIIWDVGHQAYAHKLLTGRWDRFSSLRTLNGISGFPSRAESEHDVFGVGHSSTSLSAALAFAWARRGTPQWTVAVIGDGGLTAGLAFEALNNFSSREIGPALIVLNDNQMSISQSIGALSTLISSGGAPMFFEQIGLEYIGPLDGHDLRALTAVFNGLKLREVSGSPRPVLVHVISQKGKGYAPAEELPEAFHGINPLSEKVYNKADSPMRNQSYSEIFGTALCALAKEDPRILAITAAMPEGTGLAEFGRTWPERFFDVGIAESHAVTFAAGLAANGYKPVVAIYSSFLQRGLDQLIHDVALQNFGVVFAIDRAGLVGADGATHHGVFDLSFLSMIPGLRIFAPECNSDMSVLLKRAVSADGPVAIRYPRGAAACCCVPLINGIRCHQKPDSGFAPQLILIAAGAATHRVKSAIELLGPSAAGILFLSTPELKPLPSALILALQEYPGAPVLCVEDSILHGGFGQSLAVACGARAGQIHFAGYSEHFITHGTTMELEAREGVSPEGIASRIIFLLKQNQCNEKAD
ncbi:MAG TPA: 1-deoxy-D-xylulose-5-phosphate synthase [Bdellovibrionales bacterium]|nr:MAG: hypothetical protein A2Z97_05870 [Bdellovibrionales bacterium GWB1_52_6]OFZ04402.1 MAG: hypothetical protein A2X97_07085 [Bdellovibrionales bacterium GWA1_52_35]HAR44145.1 1-deoxy-D-xylulose-5-phosphate synthase [Bdellovibrionales bacterium]HCM40742.1 1-deoxy-D-xylulose-5-phosphate synthase [Bdellovibrionales bacterium]